MKKIIIIFAIFAQLSLFAQTQTHSPRNMLNVAGTKIELQRWLNGKDIYEKIVLTKNDINQDIITIGIDTSKFRDMCIKSNWYHVDSHLGKKLNVDKFFYTDSTFSVAVTKTDMIFTTVCIIQCQKENNEWKVNNLVELPFHITFSTPCNVFFISNDVIYVDEWHKIGGKERAEDAYTLHYPYIVILGENGTYTKFVQEGKEYPPERPRYITLPPTKP